MKITTKVPNQQGEMLDVLIEGDPNKGTCILVHGFGTNKHETGGLFDDISTALQQDFQIIRFDFSGYGESEGKQEESNYKKQAGELSAILNYCRQQNSTGPFNIVAVSAGCYVTAMAAPQDIHKCVCISIPDQTTDTVINTMKQLVEKRGGTFDPAGITIFPRSTGRSQQVGPTFWKVLRSINPLELIKHMSGKTKLLLIHAKDDELIDDKNVTAYQDISAQFISLPGDHAFTVPQDRRLLIAHISKFLTT